MKHLVRLACAVLGLSACGPSSSSLFATSGQYMVNFNNEALPDGRIAVHISAFCTCQLFLGTNRLDHCDQGALGRIEWVDPATKRVIESTRVELTEKTKCIGVMPDPNPDLKEGTRVVIETKAVLPASCRQTLTLDSGKGTLATSSVVELNSLTTDCTEGAFGP